MRSTTSIAEMCILKPTLFFPFGAKQEKKSTRRFGQEKSLYNEPNPTQHMQPCPEGKNNNSLMEELCEVFCSECFGSFLYARVRVVCRLQRREATTDDPLNGQLSHGPFG